MSKASRFARHPDDAVSSVVGAVLVFSLFVTIGVMYTINTLPQKIGDREHNHQREVQSSLGALRAGLEELSGRNDPGPITSVVPLGTPPVALLQRVPANGDLGFKTGSSGFTVAMTGTSPRMFMVDGIASGSLGSTSSKSSVVDIEAFSIGLTTSTSCTSSCTTGSASMTVTFTDAVANTLIVKFENLQSSSTTTACGTAGLLQLTVTPPSSTADVYPVVCGAGYSATYPKLDLLNGAFGVSGALSRMTTPISWAFTTASSGSFSAPSPTYAAVWKDSSNLLQVSSSSGGVSVTKPVPDPPTDTSTIGRIQYTPHYQKFPSQTLSFEGGAVIASLGPNNQAVAVNPSFAIVNNPSGGGSLTWTLVQMTGSGGRGGTDDATVSVTHTESSDLVFQATNPVFTITTPNGKAWANLATEKALAAGSTSVSSSSSTTSATLTFTGTWTMHIRLVYASATIT